MCRHMGFGYAPRTRNIFDPAASESFRLSRSKLDLFLNCPRCFYLDRRLGIGQPGMPPFSLNNAVDALLKREFDIHRAARSQHPLLKHYGVDAVPFQHPSINFWRDALRGGIQFEHKPSNFLVTGGVDDVWLNPAGELIIVDYKATSKPGEVNLDAEWQIGYKRQMEIYQWLFRQNGFTVSPTGYFVYCNGDADKEAFDGRLEFSLKLIPYEGNDGWVDAALVDAAACLKSEALPEATPDCDYCLYTQAVAGVIVRPAVPVPATVSSTLF